MNETPREILFKRHEFIQPKLDALRRQVLTKELRADILAGPEAGSATCQPHVDFLRRAWRELFWSSRRVWAGLAAAWILILAVNLATRDGQPNGQLGATAPLRSWLTLLHEQEQLLSELDDNFLPPPAPAPPPFVPRPRSERRHLCLQTV